MSKETPRYVVIKRSGVAVNMTSGLHANMDYWQVLNEIHAEFMSSGANWDRPTMLLHNGEVVVPGGLADLAYEYGQTLAKARDEAQLRVRIRYAPAWLPSPDAQS